MTHASPAIADLGLLPVVLAAFLMPGWLLSRILPVPAPFGAAFIGSCILLHSTVILLQVGRVPLHQGTVGLGIVLTSIAMAVWLLQRHAEPIATKAIHIRTGLPSILWTIPCAIASASVLTRIVLDPLSGFDNGFRWDYLARLMVARQSLDGYPPVTAEDFEYYAWCDSIPPMVASLNFLIYSMTGSIAPSLTAIRIGGEAVVVASLVYRNSQLLWGDRAGMASVAFLSSSALALWALAIGQETGLTTISLLGLLYFLELHRRRPAPRLLFWAALAASLGSLAREYGLSFVALGCAVLLARGRPWREWALFLTVATAVAAPWYIRTWLLTGNPIFPMSLGGLLPGNLMHETTMHGIASIWGLNRQIGAFASFSLSLGAVAALLPVIGGLVGMLRSGRSGVPIVLAIVLVTGLWIWSLPYTGGGWAYSTRVLMPALALLAVFSGWIALHSKRVNLFALLVVATVSVDAARRSWFLPGFPFLSPLETTVAKWQDIDEALDSISTHPIWDALVGHAAGRGIVVDHPANHALITLRGGRAVPVFSPALAPSFSSSPDRNTVLSHFSAKRIGVVALPLGHSMNSSAVVSFPFWSGLFNDFAPNAVVEQLHIYDLDDLIPRSLP